MQHFRRLFCCLVLTLVSTALFAQQVGSISGKVMASDKSALPGVTVEARSNVLPQPRVTTTGTNGDYTLQALIPGKYTVTFNLSGVQTVTRQAEGLPPAAKAVDFDRAGGFFIDSVSKSGTNKMTGEVQYQLIRHNFSSTPSVVTSLKYQEDRNWWTADVGGPIIRDRLFFFGSFYRPTRSR